ncbi:MAG: hypothetical protein M3O34_08250 [Chloroflexota bacterium]|nr:hypothetical protein [Chloroflexota bacterium]
MARRGTGRLRGWCAALLAMVALLAFASSVIAQETHEIEPLGTDPARGVDRYQVTIKSGGSLWDIGFNRLPVVALDQGEQHVVELVEQAFRAEYPERGPNDVRVGDRFLLEVPSGTFVAQTIDRRDDRVVFESYAEDQLTTFPGDPVIVYRLRRKADPGRAEVLIHGGPADAYEEAKRVYDVDPPDFLQVRTVRGALMERQTKLTVDLTKKYLDEFRNVRDRASRVADAPDGLKAYSFEQDAEDIPFVRVEDGVGDEVDPGNFPRVFRIAYFRDGTIRRYIVTEAGDSIGALSRPDNATWARILPQYQEWLPGEAETLQPFSPAISAAGALLPGRILVLTHRPRIAPPSPRPLSAGSGAGTDCLGLPFGLLLAGGAWVARARLLG